MSWIYSVDKGLENSKHSLTIEFGNKRAALRRLLSYSESVNTGRGDTEDSYNNIGNSKDWLRLAFDDNDDLQEIEVLTGRVIFKDVEIKVDGDLRSTIENFLAKGVKLQEHDYGFVSTEYKFDLGDGSKSGGEDDKISWFYASTDVRHILE